MDQSEGRWPHTTDIKLIHSIYNFKSEYRNGKLRLRDDLTEKRCFSSRI